MKTIDDGNIRKFETGATRDTGANKNDYEGFLSPLVLEAFGDYMNENRLQTDGTLRDSDNWQKGIPKPVYMKSAFRHFFQWWKIHRGLPAVDEKGRAVDLKHAIGGLLFNVMGYLHESLKAPSKIFPDFPRCYRKDDTIFVLVTSDIGRSFDVPSDSWGECNWDWEEMQPGAWSGVDRPTFIGNIDAVAAGLPNDTDNWPRELRANGWPQGRRKLFVDEVKNSETKESPLNE